MKVKTKDIVIAALLTALAIIIPMIMPLKVIMPPFTATLASHTPIIIAMFVSPLAALITSLGSALGFLMSLGPVVSARAATHVVFAVVGAYMIKRHANIYITILVTLVLHAISDMAIVFILAEGFGMADILKGNTMYIVQTTIGVGTAIHHVVDFLVAYVIMIPLSKAMPNLFEKSNFQVTKNKAAEL